jgi:predicted DCC family thiol-disulfide oxidoreductase YuxK
MNCVSAEQAMDDPGFEVEVFFDGDCPLCVREIALLQRLDAKRRRIRFTDIAAVGFQAEPLGVSYVDLMQRIHGRLPDGRLIEGVEVFRRLYSAVGFRRLVAFTRLPVVRLLLVLLYNVFARNRLRLTGRCTPDLCAPRPSSVE